MDTKRDHDVCDFCSERFSTQNELQEHYVALHIVQTTSITTDDVTASMTSTPVKTAPPTMKLDRELASGDSAHPAVATESSDTASREPTEPSVGLECDQCLRTFKTKAAFSRHCKSAAYSKHSCKTIRQLKRRQCAVCRKVVNSLEKHMLLHNRKSSRDTRKVAASRDKAKEGIAINDRTKRRVSSGAAAAVMKQECTVCGKVFRYRIV